MANNEVHVVVADNAHDDPNEDQMYFCKADGCWFESSNLTEVAQHTVSNQFIVPNK